MCDDAIVQGATEDCDNGTALNGPSPATCCAACNFNILSSEGPVTAIFGGTNICTASVANASTNGSPITVNIRVGFDLPPNTLNYCTVTIPAGQTTGSASYVSTGTNNTGECVTTASVPVSSGLSC